MNNKEIFANNLNYYMKTKRKSRKEVCNDLGISYYTFTDWVKGKKYPRMDKVEILAKYFNIKKSDLIENSQPSYEAFGIDVATKLAKWFEEVGTVDFNEDEVNELITFAKFLLSKRGEK